MPGPLVKMKTAIFGKEHLNASEPSTVRPDASPSLQPAPGERSRGDRTRSLPEPSTKRSLVKTLTMNWGKSKSADDMSSKEPTSPTALASLKGKMKEKRTSRGDARKPSGDSSSSSGSRKNSGAGAPAAAAAAGAAAPAAAGPSGASSSGMSIADVAMKSQPHAHKSQPHAHRGKPKRQGTMMKSLVLLKTSHAKKFSKRLRRKSKKVAPEELAYAPAKDLEEACRLLSGVSVPWEHRDIVIGGLPGLLAKAKAEGNLKRELRALVEPYNAQLNELRSGIVRTACSVLRKLADEHHGELVVLVNGVLGQLLRNLYVTIKVISGESMTTASHILKAAPHEASLTALIKEHVKDSHHQTRTGAAIVLGQVLSDETFALPPKTLGPALTELAKLIKDSNGACRTAAATAYWHVHGRFPKEAEAMAEKLEPKAAKLVKSKKPKGRDSHR